MGARSNQTPFDKELSKHRKTFQQGYRATLAETSFSRTPTVLRQATMYSLKAGGKRIRPILSLEAAAISGLKPRRAMQLATALECVQTYSLVHDDLPVMDNDPMRRGKPSCHIAYGEGTALLVGDGLLTMGFELLGLAEAGGAATAYFAECIGLAGMVGGQYLDMNIPDKPTPAYLRRMHRLKTGRLIESALMVPFLVAGVKGARRQRLSEWAADLGTLFQVVDDVLDGTRASEALGKTAGKDERDGKLTYVQFYGLEGARSRARRLSKKLSEQALRLFPDSILLKEIPRFMLERQS